MTERSCQVVILAAGEGARMNSSVPKVMHKVAGLPMLGHVLKAASAAGARRVAVVVPPHADDVTRLVGGFGAKAETFVQSERRGTAHAVQTARAALKDPADDVLVLYGDTPLITAATLGRMRGALAGGAVVAVLGFRASNPSGYGRLIVEKGKLTAIREDQDASAAERAGTLCNGGIMAFSGGAMLSLLDRVGSDNAKREFYLTDVVAIANSDGLSVVVVEADEDEVLGVNTRAELAAVERVWQDRRRNAAMAAGATLVAPETVHFAHDTMVGRDVVIEPSVVFGPGTVIEDGARINAFSYIEGARIGPGASVGPFARLRPGTVIGDGAKIGNFCEIKNANVGTGAKINHLSYIGDASVGAATNIGAGTITCNYDGIAKYRTEIGAGSFIGSNSALVAPVTIGDDAYVASGSVITEDVEAGALAIARGLQVNKPGWVKKFRSRQ
jgi:bifunctional UDP-N-acetylglucosamine pyrophosphorylase/glucosamine-1-phosphate N-acetyltransferase